MSWTTPVTNRTGGYYTYEDARRVGRDVQYLADLLNGYGYTVTVTAKADWLNGQPVQMSEMERYLADAAALKAAFYGTVELPGSIRFIDYQDANNIELLLLEIERNINNMVAAFWYCGEIGCGEI